MKRLVIRDDFWNHVDTSGECWIWKRAKNKNTGYGNLSLGQGKSALAHRFAYELYYQRIDTALQVDHLCKNTLCVNPLHLELVTPRVNNLRSNSRSSMQAKQTHCVWGHKFDVPNTYLDSRNRRHCRECRSRRMAEFFAPRGKQWANRKLQEAKAKRV